jgi:hypothetical protein
MVKYGVNFNFMCLYFYLNGITTRKTVFSHRFRDRNFSVALETILETGFFIFKVNTNQSLYRLLLNYRDRIRAR